MCSTRRRRCHEGLSSLRLWEPGLAPPIAALEVVSPGHPYKDYIDTPDRAAACGVPASRG